MTARIDACPPSRQPRAEGEASLRAKLRDGRTRLADLRLKGSLKVLLPTTGAADLTAVLLNTAGGITGGDRFDIDAAAEPGARLTLTSQAAERAYRAQPGETGRVHAGLSAAAGARIDWLPQETILFDGAALRRRLDVDLAEDARLLAVEPVVFGRHAHGERLASLCFSDQWRVRRAGRLIYADALRVEGDAAAMLARPGTLAGAGAMASLLLAAPEAEGLLAPLRRLLPPGCGASLILPDVLAARLTAVDGFALRTILMPALELLRGAPLPRPWTM